MTSTEKFTEILNDLGSADPFILQDAVADLYKLSGEVIREETEPPNWPTGQVDTETLHSIADMLHTAYQYEMRELDQ